VSVSQSSVITATGPDGWVGYPDWAMDGPEPLRADAPNGIVVLSYKGTPRPTSISRGTS
jgi:hypothetical protein